MKARQKIDVQTLNNKRITRRMKKINDRFEKKAEEKCPICLNLCASSFAVLPCSHRYCIPCISYWWSTNSTCPYCRQSFQFVFDSKGKKLKQSEIPKNLLKKHEETLKCEACWADIGDQPMRICHECRGIYMHKRCMYPDQLKSTRWRCQQCYQNQEQKIQKLEEIQMRQRSYVFPYKLKSISLSQRHSQRLLSQTFPKLN